MTTYDKYVLYYDFIWLYTELINSNLFPKQVSWFNLRSEVPRDVHADNIRRACGLFGSFFRKRFHPFKIKPWFIDFIGSSRCCYNYMVCHGSHQQKKPLSMLAKNSTNTSRIIVPGRSSHWVNSNLTLLIWDPATTTCGTYVRNCEIDEILGKLRYFTHLNSSAMKGDDSPQIIHDSRVWSQWGGDEIYSDICIYYIPCHNSPIIFPSYPIKSLFVDG